MEYFMRNLLLMVCFLSSITAMATPPKVEFYLTKYDGKNCLIRAERALKESGFTITSGTFVGEDRVGVNGNFKGAVGCSSEVPTSVVFLVSGSDYKTASQLARQIQRNFMSSEL
jgi:hypothetical protein